MRLALLLLEPIFRFTAKLLVKYQERTGLLPTAYFYIVSTVFPAPAVELLVLRKKGEATEIFLTRREKTDPHWPNMWHYPGTVVRNGDIWETVSKRLAKELGVDHLPKNPEPKGFAISDMRPRGWCAHNMHVMWVTNEVFATGQFFDLAHLPQDMIPFQKTALSQVDTNIFL